MEKNREYIVKSGFFAFILMKKMMMMMGLLIRKKIYTEVFLLLRKLNLHDSFKIKFELQHKYRYKILI